MNFNLEDLKRQDFITRSKTFHKEYSKLVELFRCDFRAILEVSDGGIIPKIVVIDATERLEEIKKEKEKK